MCVVQARRTQFVETRAKIDHIRPELIRTCVVRAAVPPPPDFSNVNWDELLDADVQAVAEIGDGEHGDVILGATGWVNKGRRCITSRCTNSRYNASGRRHTGMVWCISSGVQLECITGTWT